MLRTSCDGCAPKPKRLKGVEGAAEEGALPRHYSRGNAFARWAPDSRRQEISMTPTTETVPAPAPDAAKKGGRERQNAKPKNANPKAPQRARKVQQRARRLRTKAAIPLTPRNAHAEFRLSRHVDKADRADQGRSLCTGKGYDKLWMTQRIRARGRLAARGIDALERLAVRRAAALAADQ